MRHSPKRGVCSLETCILRSEGIAGALTPVPGGVGPLTVAMVLRNTVTAAELRAQGKAGM